MRDTAFLGEPPDDVEAALMPWTCLSPSPESEEVVWVSYPTRVEEGNSAVSQCQ
jgi:hypothetical protein